jgi:hypothetical protein
VFVTVLVLNSPALLLPGQVYANQFAVVPGEDAAHCVGWVRPDGHAALDRLRGLAHFRAAELFHAIADPLAECPNPRRLIGFMAAVEMLDELFHCDHRQR